MHGDKLKIQGVELMMSNEFDIRKTLKGLTKINTA